LPQSLNYADTRSSEMQISPDIAEEGIQVVEEILRTWSSGPSPDDGDVSMSEDLSPEYQLAELRKSFEKYKPRIEGNQWLQTLLTTL
jgi:DNA mismatch repair protein MSH2